MLFLLTLVFMVGALLCWHGFKVADRAEQGHGRLWLGEREISPSAALFGDQGEYLRVEASRAVAHTMRGGISVRVFGGAVLLLLLAFAWRMFQRNIQAQAVLQERLDASEHWNRLIFESSGEGFEVIGREGEVLCANPRAKEWLHGAADPAGVRWETLWKETTREAARSALEKARSGTAGHFRGLSLEGEDSPRWLDVTLLPFGGKEPGKVVAILRDITELLRVGQTCRVLFEQSSGAHLLFEENGVLECNAMAAMSLQQESRAALVGKRFTEFSREFQPDGSASLAMHAEQCRCALEKGECRYEWEFIRADGGEYLVELSLTPVTLEGRPIWLAVWGDVSDRKRAEAALVESERRFQSFMDHSPTVAFIKDAKGRYIYVNKPFEEQFGVSFEKQLKGKTDSVWLPEETACLIDGIDRTVIATGEPSRMHEVMPLGGADSTEWLLLRFPMQTAAGGQLIGGVGIDVTRQKQAERQLREREAQFRDLFDDAPVAYHELDNESRFTRINTTELTMLGYGAAEMVGRPIWDFMVDEAAADEIPIEIASQLRLQASQRTFRRKDGSTVPVLMRYRLITDAQGNVRGMRSTLQDISALKRTEQELRKAEEKFRGIFENATDGIFQSTPAGAFLSVNPALALLLGYESPEALVEEVRDIGTQLFVSQERRREMLELLARHGSVADFEAENYRRDGSVILVSARVRTVGRRCGCLARVT
ncbi:MAG: PAS domain S-box protein, partial [Verrucomicrobiota bacterium]